MENFVLPIDGRNISAETNQSVHGHTGEKLLELMLGVNSSESS